MHSKEVMIATNRFGLGARPGEAAGVGADPRGWLKTQLADSAGSGLQDSALRSSADAVSDYYQWRMERKESRADTGNSGKAPDMKNRKLPDKGSPRDEVVREIAARTQFAINTPQSFRERLVRFWSNHFTVSATKPAVAYVAGAFEREAIRPYVSGRFADMLLAAEMHQAMLFYLDNFQSVGPDSVAGRRRDRGLNENQAREILELHTLGVDGGYRQEDVVELARALTGWTVSSPRDRAVTGKTWFDSRRHQPGSRVVLGRRYLEEGALQAGKILTDLAGMKQTADFLAGKLATHFIADKPPPAAVEKLAGAFMDSNGNLAHVSAVLVDLDEAWNTRQQKFKSPDEFNISASRGLGLTSLRRKALRATYGSLGQAPFTAPSPAGWPDDSESWLGPDAIKKRFEWSAAVAAKARGRNDPRVFLAETLGEVSSSDTRFMINGADSREQGLTLALMSPEFQRR